MPKFSYESALQHHLAAPLHAPLLSLPSPSFICTDSRAVQQGSLYIPLVGERFNGHDFIAEAVQRGAVAFLYDFSYTNKIPQALLSKGVAVTNCLSALQAIASAWRKAVDPQQVFAITGSVGKTTAKEVLAAICKEHGPCVYPQGSYNNELGVPLTLLRLAKPEESLVLEFGARHNGDIKFLCELADPTVGCVLNVKHVHVGEFGSIENVMNTKTEMFRSTRMSATLVANADDREILARAQASGKNVLSFGYNDQADIRIMHQEWQASGILQLRLNTPQGVLELQTSQAHEAIPINIAAATAMALAGNISTDAIISGVQKFGGIKGRFQVLRTPSFTIIDDSYNASPESMRAGFLSSRKLFPDLTILGVLGDMRELGDDSDRLHKEVGRLCVNLMKPNRILCVGDNASHYAEGATAAGFKMEQIILLPNVLAAIEKIKEAKISEQVVYLKGSRAIALDQLIPTLSAGS